MIVCMFVFTLGSKSPRGVATRKNNQVFSYSAQGGVAWKKEKARWQRWGTCQAVLEVVQILAFRVVCFFFLNRAYDHNVNWQLIHHPQLWYFSFGHVVLAVFKWKFLALLPPAFVGLLRDKHSQIRYENCASCLGAVSVRWNAESGRCKLQSQ